VRRAGERFCKLTLESANALDRMHLREAQHGEVMNCNDTGFCFSRKKEVGTVKQETFQALPLDPGGQAPWQEAMNMFRNFAVIEESYWIENPAAITIEAQLAYVRLALQAPNELERVSPDTPELTAERIHSDRNAHG
jgi:hypothetical protein